jgi:type IV pilus assembly protein PilF
MSPLPRQACGQRAAAAAHAQVRMPGRCRGARLGACFAFTLLLGACQTTTNGPGPAAESTRTQVESDPVKRAQVRLQLAANYYQGGQTAIAIETVRKAIELDPQLAAAHGLLGVLLMDSGQFVQARASFDRARALAPEDPDIANNYGWFLCQTGQEREGLAEFERAAASRNYATPGRALQNAGICLRRIHDEAGAEKYLLRALAADAASNVVKFQLVQLYLAQGRLERAEFYFDLLKRFSDPEAAVLWLGVRLAHARGDREGEQRFADSLQNRFPDSTQTALLHRGRYDE